MAELIAVPLRVNSHIVAKLEMLLAAARRGEVVGISCSAEMTGGIIDSFTDSLDLVTMLGHLSREMHGCHRAMDKSAEEMAR